MILENWFFISVPSIRFDSVNVYEQTYLYLEYVIHQIAVRFNFAQIGQSMRDFRFSRLLEQNAMSLNSY